MKKASELFGDLKIKDLPKEKINMKYYSEQLTFRLKEIVLFRGKLHRIVFDFEDGNVNLENGDGFIIHNVPKFFLFKHHDENVE
jgi:hypothetical protein